MDDIRDVVIAAPSGKRVTIVAEFMREVAKRTEEMRQSIDTIAALLLQAMADDLHLSTWVYRDHTSGWLIEVTGRGADLLCFSVWGNDPRPCPVYSLRGTVPLHDENVSRVIDLLPPLIEHMIAKFDDSDKRITSALEKFLEPAAVA